MLGLGTLKLFLRFRAIVGRSRVQLALHHRKVSVDSGRCAPSAALDGPWHFSNCSSDFGPLLAALASNWPYTIGKSPWTPAAARPPRPLTGLGISQIVPPISGHCWPLSRPTGPTPSEIVGRSRVQLALHSWHFSNCSSDFGPLLAALASNWPSENSQCQRVSSLHPKRRRTSFLARHKYSRLNS